MNALQELKATTERHTISISDIVTDHKMQMRASIKQETIEQYAENIEEILEENPIAIVITETARGEKWYLVDGFHRYHAALHAGIDVVDAEVMRGTYEEALQFAMSSNWKNGMRPDAADSVRSVDQLLETAPDFGYDSKKVNPWVMDFGVPKSTAIKYTKGLRDQIDEKRDAKIEDLLNEGSTIAAIKEAVGCGVSTINKVKETISVPNDSRSQTEHQESTPADNPFFDEDELDTTPAHNPALDRIEAMNKAIKEDEQERAEKAKDTTVTSKEVSSDYINHEIDEVAAEKAQGMAEALARFLQANPRARTPELNKVLNGLVGA